MNELAGGELREFTHHFFNTLDANVMPVDQRKNGPLHVQLPAALTEHFGKETLSLAFQSTEIQNGHELVAYGSRVFDRMVSFLDRKAALSVLKLPVRHAGSEELLHAVTLLNTGTTNLKLQEQTQFLLAFNWRITYRADDKREEIYSVVMDESGSRVPQPGQTRGGEEVLDFNALLVDAESVPLETNEDGLQLPPRLPAMTQLTKLAETARKFVVYHADVRCVAHEMEILPRLHKVLSRLTSYYQQQGEEITDGQDADGARRRGLETDLQRKIAEEVDNHRLRVGIELISYAALQAPIAQADITIGDGKREATIRVRRNRYNGVIRRPRCQVCDQESARIVLDRESKVCCESCVRQCGTCLQLVSGEGSTSDCPVCQKDNCAGCGVDCAACGARACRDCASKCPVCRDTVCHACQGECANCAMRQCRSHLRADAVMPAEGVPLLVCNDCAVRCPSCKQFSAQTDTCCVSGQRYCKNCLVTCTHCKRSLNPSFVYISPRNRKPYCPDCVQQLTHAGA